MKKTTATVFVMLAAIGLAGSALSTMEIQKEYKAHNVAARCNSCHVKPMPTKSASELNDFGKKVRAAKGGDGKIDWAATLRNESQPAEGDASDDKPLSVDEILNATAGPAENAPGKPGKKGAGSSGQTPPGAKPFTNKDVLSLVKAGLGDKIVINNIRSMPGDNLDTSTDALIRLKKVGVSKGVIDAMLTRSAAQMEAVDTTRKGAAVAAPEEPASSGGAALAETIPVPTNPVSETERLSEAVARGEEVVFKIKYDTGVYPTHYLADSTLTVSKTIIAFRPTVGGDDFTVSPEKILEVTNQPQLASRVHLKAFVKVQRTFFGATVSNKERKKEFDYYNPGAAVVNRGQGDVIECTECDDSMNVLYAVLERVREKR